VNARWLVLVVTFILTASAVGAEQAGSVRRIGYLGAALVSGVHHQFEQGLAERGWTPGRNIIVEYRWYEGSAERARDLARELVRLAPDVLVAVGPFGAVAAKEATSSIPTIFALAGNPVRTGLVASLSHPGGNRTGLAYDPTPEMAGKTVQLLKEVVPSAHRIAIVWNPQSPDTEPYLREVKRSAKALGLSTVDTPVETANDFKGVFTSMTKASAEALVVIPDPVTVVYQRQLAELAAKHRLPAIYQFRQSVEAGVRTLESARHPARQTG